MRIVLAMVVALLLVPVASARNFKADIFLNPTEPEVGVENTMYGCGYIESARIQVYIIWYDENDQPAGQYPVVYPTSDADGCFSMTWTPDGPGYYEIWAFQLNKPGNTYQTRSRIEFEIE